MGRNRVSRSERYKRQQQLKVGGGWGLVGWFVSSSIMDRRVISSPLQVEEGCCMNNRDEEVHPLILVDIDKVDISSGLKRTERLHQW